MDSDPNIDLLELAAGHLHGLIDEVAFVGGCVVGLLITDEAAPAIRSTTDVDVIVEIGSYKEYDELSARLRKLGFQNDLSDGAPLCRFAGHGVTLDVMPANPEILGFANRWYQDALINTSSAELPSGRKIAVVSPPYFLATKIEAFKGRGEGDYWSQDMEDIVALVDGRPELVEEVLKAAPDLRKYVQEALHEFLDDDELRDFLPGDQASQSRLPIIIERFEAIAFG